MLRRVVWRLDGRGRDIQLDGTFEEAHVTAFYPGTDEVRTKLRALSLDADALYEIFDAHVGKRMEVIDAMEVPVCPRSRSPHA